MIVDFLINSVLGLVNTLVSALPPASTHDVGAVGTEVAAFKAWDGALHGIVTPIVSLVSLALAYHAASWLYHGLNWIYRHIPVIGGGG